MDEKLTSSVVRLLEAEKRADEIVAHAREEAEQTVALAKTRAQNITESQTLLDARHATESQCRSDLEKETHDIVEEGERRISRMREVAEMRLNEAVERLIETLFGDQ